MKPPLSANLTSSAARSSSITPMSCSTHRQIHRRKDVALRCYGKPRLTGSGARRIAKMNWLPSWAVPHCLSFAIRIDRSW